MGGTRCISVDVRIIAATNCDLEAYVSEGLFREDLYHRLNVFPITLPPLRDRRQDIPTLSRYFVRKYSTEIGKNFEEVSEAVLRQLVAYDWPGNVRELGNVIERAVVMCLGPEITPDDLPGRVAFAGRDSRDRLRLLTSLELVASLSGPFDRLQSTS